MFSTENRFAITRLNNGNYQTWKFRLEMLMTKEDTWEVVSKPIPAITEAWSKLNRQAMTTISLLVEDNQLIHIKKCEYAKDMWDALKKIHERSNLSSKLYLLRKLYRIKFEKGNDMGAHIDKISEMAEKLRGVGEEIKDQHLAAILLCSLPESYEGLITALEARSEQELTLDLVKGKVMDEYIRRKESNAEKYGTDESILKVDHTRHYRRDSRKETRTCYQCGKMGHLKNDCRTKRQGERTNHRAKAVIAKKNSEESASEEDHICFGTNETSDLNEWYVDSGATSHMCKDPDFFTKLDIYEKPREVLLADGRSIGIKGSGSGTLKCEKGRPNLKPIYLNNVLFVPELEGNLVSVKRLTEIGYIVTFKDSECNMIKNGDIVTARLKNNLYKLPYTHRVLQVNEAMHDECLHIWHQRFGHRNCDAILKLNQEHLSEGFKIKQCNITQSCEECIQGKLTRKPFPKQASNRATKPYELLHSDLCGPMKTTSRGGNKYIATIIDDYSRYCEIFLLKTKDEITEKIQDYLAKWNNVFQRKPIKIRSDGGGEYMNRTLNEYLAKEGIQRQVSVGYTPQQNGVAERKNRSLLEMARCMLLDSQLDNSYWGEAVQTAAYLQNRLPTKACEKTPYQLWFGKKPETKHIKIFGSKVHTKVPNEKLTKLDARTQTGIFVGYSEHSKGYRIVIPKTGKITVSRDVVFQERNAEKYDAQQKKGIITEETGYEELIITDPTNDNAEQHIKTQEDIILPRRSSRTTKGIPAQKLTYKAQEYETEPETWADLQKLHQPIKNKWLQAVKEELDAFSENKAWELTQLPANRNLIGCKWTFKVKRDSKGDIKQYKAWLVAKGYSQKEGEDYTDTYAPVIRYSTLRALLSIAAARGMKTRHLDVRSAFLNGTLAEEIYMEQPTGLPTTNQDLVCKLKKSIYGLKQSANTWNIKINDTLQEKGYTRGIADPCLYTKNQDGNSSYILIYVDDLLICSDKIEQIHEIRQTLESKFKMTDLGEATYYLGIRIQRLEDGTMKLDQSQKIKMLLHTHRLNQAKETQTPMESDYLNQSSQDSHTFDDNNQYRQAVGALLYLSVTTRPDICAAVSFVARKVSAPTQHDWSAVKRILKYLKTTSELGLILGKEKQPNLTGYVDADWGGDGKDRKSTSGYVFQLHGGCISWATKKQTCVSLSTTEAEYVAAATACQELLWIRQLLIDFNMGEQSNITLNEDNQGCIKLASSEKYQARSKHIDIKYHLLRDLKNKGIVDLKYCPTEDMLADVFTKPLEKTKYQKAASNLGLK